VSVACDVVAGGEPGFRSASALGLVEQTAPTGRANAITDVSGVRVGHRTVTDPGNRAVQTGVTVVLPHGGNVFREKVTANAHVINGFGKSIGLLQLEELGQLESPIALTNTFSVPAVTEGILDLLLADSPEIGTTTGTVNAVVTECNDSRLNDLRGRHVSRQHVVDAVSEASTGRVLQGAVGAGRGMCAFGLKGGVGTASRVISTPAGELTVGILTLTNFGRLEELVVGGCPVGRALAARRSSAQRADERAESGSIIVVLATDAPVSDRQLGRLLRRVQNGIARTGSITASGSGEIAVGFTTATRIAHQPVAARIELCAIAEDGPVIDALFASIAEATEEAIINSLLNAETVIGRDGRTVEGLPVPRLLELCSRSGSA